MIASLFLFFHTSFATAENISSLKKTSAVVVVAVIDTGIDKNHTALKSQLWINKGESGLDKNGQDKATNGLDDDGNGYVDDVHGWNFVNNSNDVTDEEGHGTHISGLISSTSKQTARLMVLKYFDANSSDKLNVERSNKAIEYAIKMQAQVINYSGGGSKSDPKERDLIYQAYLKNIIFVAAAGNNSMDIDTNKFYPASYGFPNLICVGAVDKNNQRAKFSNYGKTVDVVEKGVRVLSTAIGNRYTFMSGTSQATAIVSGQVALKKTQGETTNPIRLGLKWDASQ